MSNTPEQNGVLEQKHPHIVETGLTMLFHAHIPNYLWTDAFASTVFSNNRIPSQVLQNKSPSHYLFQTYRLRKFLENLWLSLFSFCENENHEEISTKNKSSCNKKQVLVFLLDIALNTKVIPVFTYLLTVFFFLVMFVFNESVFPFASSSKE